ncbi:MAG: hypothetical protein ACI89J_002631 [Hyphomicrobiaceae bacterium]|jgi:hypothetical protein
MIKQFKSARRERQPAPDALKQDDPQFIFQGIDLPAECRLRHAKRAGRS